MRIVIYTNIVISAALSQHGNPAKIISYMTDNDNVQFYYSKSICAEYKKVLAYERLKISLEIQEKMLNILVENGILIDPEPEPSDITLPDETDRIFYDAAKTNNAYLITGDTKHYPNESFILTPAQFAALLG